MGAIAMLTACTLLLAMGLLGAFDIAYFHHHQAKLSARPESRTEGWLHVARGVVYAAQFAIVPNLRFAGLWYAVFGLLFVVDIGVAIADVLVEPASRKSQGGLPPGEYLAHIVLSIMAGAYLRSLVLETAPWASLPSGISFAPAAPSWLRAVLGLMSAGCLSVAAMEAIALAFPASSRPRPLHVSVRLRTSVEELWEVTQDHLRHPTWDHRFSRIEMLADEIETGTEMIYERDLVVATIRGGGRYKLHRPLKQSTFEFWSDDVRSLIRRGVGLWLYLPKGDGTVELSTSYTYEVRWGALGRLLDRVAFRPFFQRETERSFARLAKLYFPEGSAPVLGAHGRKPARLSRSKPQLMLEQVPLA